MGIISLGFSVTPWEALALSGVKLQQSVLAQPIVAARIEGGEDVRLRGALEVKAAETLGAGEEMILLPAALRPPANIDFPTITFPGLLEIRITIGSNGKVRCGGTALVAGESVIFNGFVYPLA